MSKTLKGTFIGEAMIYRRDDWGYPQYSVKLSNQNQQTGEWEYSYMQVGLPKNALINDKTEIIINKSFFSFCTPPICFLLGNRIVKCACGFNADHRLSVCVTIPSYDHRAVFVFIFAFCKRNIRNLAGMNFNVIGICAVRIDPDTQNRTVKPSGNITPDMVIQGQHSAAILAEVAEALDSIIVAVFVTADKVVVADDA